MISDVLFDMKNSLENESTNVTEILEECQDEITEYKSHSSYLSNYSDKDRLKIDSFEKELDTALSSGNEDNMKSIINKGYGLAQDLASLPI